MRTFIFGTDWWDDCDDAVALRLLARAHKSGKIKLGGIVINAVSEWSVPSVDGFLALEGVSDIPIALDFDATDYPGESRYQPRLAAFAVKYPSNAHAEPAVKLYRRILAESEDKVDIVEVGFLQALAELICSKADDISPLDGTELLCRKCNRIWAMAGKWDEDGGKENNICKTDRSVKGAATVFESCPVPITFLGFEAGVSVISGSALSEKDFLHRVLVDHGSANGRCSWDPMTALLALIGDEKEAGYSITPGKAVVNPQTGQNHFFCGEDKPHRYVTKTKPDKFYSDMIDLLIKTEE